MGEEVAEEILPELISPDYSQEKKANMMLSACTALFSMDLINKIHWRFVSEREIISEDVYSLMNLFGHVACVGGFYLKRCTTIAKMVHH